MALLTQKVLMMKFEEMLKEMSFDKITVSELVRRSHISPNTFYYHYENIYALLDTWIARTFEEVLKDTNNGADSAVKLKKILLYCQEHSAIIYNIFYSLSREQLERYVILSTDEAVMGDIRKRLAGYRISEEEIKEIAKFCHYTFVGFFVKFLWDNMEVDVERHVNQLQTMLEIFIDSAILHFSGSGR